MQTAEMPRPEEAAFAHWLAETEPHGLAQALDHAAPEERVQAFAALPADKAARTFELLDPVNQADLLARAPGPVRQRLLDGMEPDDRARMLAILPEPEAARLLNELSPAERALTGMVLRHPEHSAGRIMSPEYVRLSPAMTVAEALAAIRRQARRAETVYLMPVADADMRLVGTVELASLVLADPATRIAEIASRDVPRVRVDDDQEAVARLMKSADLVAVPVVEDGDRLVGIVTFDDAMEVLEFEEGEDLARTGAAEPIGRPYLSVPVLRLVRSRIVWLSVLAVAAALTVNVLEAFEATLQQAVSLALFIPLLIGIGGNAGAQSATTIVRALAVRDVRPRDVLRVAWRELRTGLAMGLVLAAAAFVLLALLFDRPLALVVATAMVAICGLAALVGGLMPIAARSLAIDPAVFSAPFVTTIVDACGLLIYFTLARAVLGL